MEANEMAFDLISPEEPAEPTDPKAKAAAAKAGQFAGSVQAYRQCRA